MKITIEPETDIEKKALAEPWVRTGCLRFGLSGIGERAADSITGEFGFLHGDNMGIRGDLARVLANLEMQIMQQMAINGVLKANELIANAQMQSRVAEELLANRNGLKLHRL